MTTNDTEQGGVPEISEAAFAEALRRYHAVSYPTSDIAAIYKHAFARFIQEVSDAVGGYIDNRDGKHPLAPFILPEPVDPLYEALFAVVELGRYDTREQTELLRAELAKRGLKIVEAKP